MLSEQGFLDELAEFMKAYGFSESDFGRLFMRDPNFISETKAGRSPTLRTVDRLGSMMARAERISQREGVTGLQLWRWMQAELQAEEAAKPQTAA